MAGFGCTGEFATGEYEIATVLLISAQDGLSVVLGAELSAVGKFLLSMPVANGRVFVVEREDRTVIVPRDRREIT